MFIKLCNNENYTKSYSIHTPKKRGHDTFRCRSIKIGIPICVLFSIIENNTSDFLKNTIIA